MPLKAVIFDFDGTLVDSRNASWAVGQCILNHYHVSLPTRETFLLEIASDFLGFYYSQGIPEHVTRQTLNDLWKRYFLQPHHLDLLCMRTGATEILQLCHHHRLNVGIVSGNAHTLIVDRLRFFNVLHLVHHVRADAGRKVRELQETLAHFELEPEEVAYVDDTFHGLHAARSVGMTAVGIMGGFNTERQIRSARPHFVISELDELITLIPQLIA